MTNGIFGGVAGLGVLGRMRNGRGRRPLGAAPSPTYPDTRVKQLQDALNTPLQNRSCTLLKVDGLIGPKTCGATKWAVDQGIKPLIYLDNATDFITACSKIVGTPPPCQAAAVQAPEATVPPPPPRPLLHIAEPPVRAPPPRPLLHIAEPPVRRPPVAPRQAVAPAAPSAPGPAQPSAAPPMATAGMSATTKLALGLSAAAIATYFVFFRKKAAA